MDNLAQLEALCERLYNSHDAAERAHAENTLKCFSVDSNYISQCQYVLENASNPYALMMASSSLLKQVTEKRLPLQLRLDIRNYVISYLATRGPDLKNFVIGSLIQLFCRITKFGWLDDDSFREVVKESTDFLSQATCHYAIGLKILSQLISEMFQPNPVLSLTQQRRVACSFRDLSLLQIFQISLTSLSQLKNDVGSNLQELAVSLALKCLSFDFMGTSLDESSEDFGSIQVPSSWKQVIEDPSTLQIFFDYYALSKPHVSREVSNFIYNHGWVLALMRANTNKDLVRPAATRFATDYLTLQSMHSLRQPLEAMFTSREWANCSWAKKPEGREARKIILSDRNFWGSVGYAIKTTKPLVSVLRMTDSEKVPGMRFLYGAMDNAKEEIAKNLDNEEGAYKEIWSIIDAKWDNQLHRHLHAAAYFLNPHFHYDDIFCANVEVKVGLYACMDKLIANSEEREKADLQLDAFRLRQGLFGYTNAKNTCKKRAPADWWIAYGDEAPELRNFAVKILSLTCSSSACERNWSTFSQALGCLVRLASVRRSLFTNAAARLKYLAHLMIGTKDILQTGKGLADHDNYHEFCRLLGRFKITYELSEIVSTDSYSDWISLVAGFTLKSLQSWQWASISVYYLLELWSRLVSSLRYFKGETPSLLNELVLEIIQSFISSKFDSFQVGLSDDLSENPLDNAELLQDHLECIRPLCRFQYESCSMYILQFTDSVMQMYMEATNLEALGDNSNLFLLETKLSWMVHIVAAILKIKSSGESDELHDAELSARVFSLINITDSRFQNQRYNELSKQRLDHAILIFFQHFLKSYVGDQAMESSKRLYTRFSELLGLGDHLQVLNVIVGKIATNLKCYVENADVISHTLKLFLEMASGYTSGKLLLKLDTVQLIISQPNRDHFPFLRDNRLCRSRTTFFYTIGLLVFTEDSLLKFKSSVDPLMQVFVNLETIPDEIFRTDTVKQALIGLMRDLRGFAMATNSRRTYGLLFDWLYPRMPLLLKAIAHWTDTPEVTTPLLKFMAEFVLNKSQRLTFDMSSANGILLFREVSKLLVSYGSRILPLINHVDMYAFKYKGIWISLTILSRALAGNYVNFGVFELYGDRALADALDISLKMALSVPLTDILAYRKLSRAYFAFLEILLKTHITFILNLDSSTFTFLAGSIQSGLKLLDTNILAQCASAADFLATFYFSHITAGELPTTPASLNLARHVADCPSIFPEILKSLFEIVLFDDCVNQWTLSRPMLSLILISEEMFANLKARILVSQPAGEQERLSLCFDNLMTGVTQSLDTKNRDRFTQNLTRFRNEFRSR